ncbi:hypothetical protein AMST5_00861 [freshwater sediment metagenome]|uniref:Uncharacterized protein n=1 Tax=freshwater sediment metagenome TaxID=556182 RepID=A0AA48LXQ2_9ZZZZ
MSQIKTHLTSLIPTDHVPNLIGSYDGSVFEGIAVGGDVYSAQSLTCKKGVHQIEIELSNLKLECNEDGGQIINVISGVGIIANTPLGRLYSHDASPDQLHTHAFILAEIKVSSDGSGSWMEASQGDVLTVTLEAKSQEFWQLADSLQKNFYSRLLINMELWKSDQMNYYVHPGRNEILSFELELLKGGSQLDFSLDELAAAVLTRRAGEEVFFDSRAMLESPKSGALSRVVIAFIEIAVAILLIYWNLH